MSTIIRNPRNTLRTRGPAALTALLLLAAGRPAAATVTEFNSSGGTNASNGLHVYIDDSTRIQILRLNGGGQVYHPNFVPPSGNMDNGIFLRANGKVYGPSHNIGGGYTPSGGLYSTHTLGAASPPNPPGSGIQQSATGNFGITSGPQLTVLWKYTTPLDFITAEVSLTIPAGYAVSSGNPVRYTHVVDTYLGGNDKGCGYKTGTSGSLVVGTYPPAGGGSVCGSGNGVPSGVSVVESFRERSGQSFSHYCVSDWGSFYSSGGNNCYVGQSAAFSDTIVTNYQDTGAGIQYEFSAPGTYSFSYDFVIGSPAIPQYDHLEIQHDGAATLCPENVTVLACKTAGMPCASDDIVNTGTLTGNVSLTPVSPAVTVTPATFTLGATASTATVALQASAPGGTYTLGVSNLSSIPTNGIKCWNTATSTSSCSMVIANTPCVANFECMDSSVATYNNLVSTPSARNPMYTRLAGTDFKFDVLALQASGALASNYSGTVTVELFDDTASPAPACNAYSAPVASQVLAFAAGDNGRKTLASNINLARAYRKLRCRVRDNTLNPVVYGCSSDDFTVRPLAVTAISSADATADSAGVSATNTPTIKAGAGFNLAADTGTVGYDDKPKVNTNLLEWQGGAGTGVLNGLFATAANSATGNGASGAAFAYDEVGYFRFQPQGVYDDSYTTYSADAANGDCTNDASNTLNAAGKYGCRFGNTVASPYFGRFIPDHFALASSSLMPACAAGGFSYLDQTLALAASMEARNAANSKTMNYSGAFAKGVVTPQMLDTLAVAPFTATVVVATRLGGLGTPVWDRGAYPFVATRVSRLGSPDGPYDSLAFGLSVADSDLVPLWDRNMDAANPGCTPDPAGTSSSAASACKAVKLATGKLRYGRLKLDTAHGSELLALPVPLRLEYWNGAGGWKINTLDSCSTLAASNFSLAFPAGTAAKPNHLAACETALSVQGAPPAQTVRLSAPGAGNDGWTDVTLNLDSAAGNQCVALGATGPAALSANMKYLQFNWLGTGAKDPVGRETFGIYKNANEFIYLRELH